MGCSEQNPDFGKTLQDNPVPLTITQKLQGKF